MRRVATGTLLTTMAAGAAIAYGPAAQAATDKPEIIGHRGGVDWGTENSVRTIKHAFASGADAVEIDVQWTKDLRTVVMHDNTMNRTTNCSGTVTTITYKKFRSCKLNDGTTAPNVYEALMAVRDAGKRVYVHVRGLDSKTKVDKLERALEKYGLNNTEDTVVISTNKAYLNIWKKYGGETRRGYLFNHADGWDANYSVLLPYDIPVTREKVDKAQRGGHRVVVVENHPVQLKNVLNVDLDGFMANGLQAALLKLGRALQGVTDQLDSLNGRADEAAGGGIS
ncbi:MAG: glycerophosphodiester phosphodiesterase [Sporichthyaceae bacterium]